MENKLRCHVDILFQHAPVTQKAMEMKEELLQNLQEKYYDLLAEGKGEEAAFNIAVAGIGDVSELIGTLTEPEAPTDTIRFFQQERQRSALLIAAAVMLYILSLIPLYMALELWYWNEAVLICITIIMVAAATGLLVYNQLTSSYKPPKRTLTIVDELQYRMQRKGGGKMRLSISVILWTLTTVFYILFSSLFHVWHVAWVVFLLALAGEALISIYFTLKK